MLKHNDTQLLTVKELAWRLNRHSNYVYLMKKAGFSMPGYRATLEGALEWLQENPNWRRKLLQPRPRVVLRAKRQSPRSKG